jgi:methylmalonyl-CoA/ethylmalonyl-CoA epimerase
MASSERQPLGELDHVGIVVADLKRATRFFERVLGLSVSSEATLADAAMKIAFLRSGTVRIELIEILDEEGRRERLGEAEARIEHLAFRVDRLEPAAAAAAGEGVDLVGGFGPGAPPTPFQGPGTASLFSRAESSAGVMIQLVQMLDAKEER